MFKGKIIRYINEVIFEMVKTSLKDTYLVVTTPAALKNEFSTFQQMYYDRETRVMVN